MSAPNISSYKDALRTPEHSLQRLSYLQPVPGVHDDFYFSSGNFAVVFKMEDTKEGSFKALKCFTRDQERRRESLHLISNYLNQIQSEYIIPYTYLEDEIWADAADHPVLLMDWIEGETLGEYVSKLCECHDRYGLERLCQEFVHLSLWLLDQPWAHGDLKHDNILVRPDGSLVLVDYDGCFVPGMGGQEAREMGSPSFRHPKRTIKDFHQYLDDFSILVIFLSLRILAVEPALLQEQQDGENLVLSISDIATPANSALLEKFRQYSDDFLKVAIVLLDRAVEFQPGHVDGLRDVLKKWLNEEIRIMDMVPSNMVYVKGGTFEMGDVLEDITDDGFDEISCTQYMIYDEHVHWVTVGDFLLSKHALTFEEYDKFCEAKGRNLPHDDGWGRGQLPVINVDWYDAIEYCNWRSELEGLQVVYRIYRTIENPDIPDVPDRYDQKKWLVQFNKQANGYRLPTEAEWEYAARERGKKIRFGNGKDIANPKEINFSGWRDFYSIEGENREGTVPVGSLNCPNALGLHDMSGNVWEWCWDLYDFYPDCSELNWGGPFERVSRGGSCFESSFYCRVSKRERCEPFTGFRLARTP